MHRRSLTIAILAALSLSPDPIVAGEAALSASEIRSLLTDREIVGDWNGRRYRQHFSASGQTLYSPENGRPDAGRWRVNHDTDSYESFWQNSGWSSYGIVRRGNDLFWRDSRGKLYPFELVPD